MFNTTVFAFLVYCQANSNRCEPYFVQAVIDTAVIIGLPSSKEAKQKAREFQKSDLLSIEAEQANPTVGWRKLYLRTHFQ